MSKIRDVFDAVKDRIFAHRHPATNTLVEELYGSYIGLYQPPSVEKIESAIKAGADVNSDRYSAPLVICTNVFAHAAWMAEPDNGSWLALNGHTVTKQEWQDLADRCLVIAKMLIEAGANPCDRQFAAKPLWHLADRSRLDKSSQNYKQFRALLVDAEKRWKKEHPDQVFVRNPKP